jgi:tetratricopeptide (TPR) repeat protein
MGVTMLPDRLNRSISRAGFALVLLLPALAAHAAPGTADATAASAHYQRCLALGRADPAAALTDANSWSHSGGGVPAEHCAAMALVGLHHYAEAGPQLDALGRRKDTPAGLRAALFDQAGNAFLLAGDGAHAVASFSAALTLTASDSDLYADLARAQALQKNWNEVVLDLNAALTLAPKRADLLVLRASAHRALGQIPVALADIQAALMMKRDPGALVERGLLKRQAGDLGGARGDFRAALAASPSPAVAAEAKENLDAISEDAVKP